MSRGWHCETCRRDFREEELRPLQIPRLDRKILVCPTCRRDVRRVSPQAQSRGFFRSLVFALFYPVQRTGWPPLIGLVLVSWALEFVPLIGGLLSGGVVCGYLFSVIRKSGEGDHTFPDTEDFSHFFELIRPLIVFYLTVLVACAPAIGLVYRFGWPPPNGPLYLAAYLAAAVFPLVYLPGAVAVVALSSSWLAPFFPLPVVRVFLRAPGAYLTTVVVSIALAILQAGVLVLMELVQILLPVPIFTSWLTGLLSLYLPLVLAHILGLLIWEVRRE